VTEQENVPATPTEEPSQPEPAAPAVTEPTAPPPPDPKDDELARLRAGYAGLQRKYDSVLREKNASTALVEEVAETVKLIRESQTAIAKSTLGEEQAQALDAKLRAATEEGQRQRAAQSAMQFIEAQTRLLTESLNAAGVDTRQIAWPTDAGSVTEWHERAREQVLKAVTASRDRYVKAVEQASAKAKADAATEAERLSEKALKEAGVGKIDKSKGSSSTARDRILAVDPRSPEFEQLRKDALAGKLKTF
jgi:hypothetical protein